ncbi:hypothetical protein A5707_14085 [Mycobacterium kyorinense]|uniref:Uncharacterized protein n=1 Tax=Mycobacterium kyorinense TaxID=487514 RepID=A0A1A2ZKQ8_9MYCO|nr:hypothetical protein [Mycobacterium kyorinense]OBI51174.1 hypothetical protein A5707_14085 [Mycobacterium kyorinense]
MATAATDPSDAARPLVAVVGANVRRIRSEVLGATHDQLAREVTALGFPWSYLRVAAFERGEVTGSLALYLIICAALDRLAQPDSHVTLADLVVSENPITLADGVVIDGDGVRRALAGTPPASMFADAPVTPPRFALAGRSDAEVVAAAGYARADVQTAAALGLDREAMVAACAGRWGRSLTAERDARAGAGASRRQLGIITSELREELSAYLDMQTGPGEPDRAAP